MTYKNERPVFGLITDFGYDFAVGSLKGVILSSVPDAQIVDVDHTIKKWSVISAAFVIERVYRYFPKGTTFICVIDPGVGTARKAVCVQVDGYTFIGPNNGIFHYLFGKPGAQVQAIASELFDARSITFHGRDIFTPAAVALSQGDDSCCVPIDEQDIVRLDILDTKTIVTFIDSFGNIKTNIPVEQLPENAQKCTVRIGTHSHRVPIVRCFDEVAPGTLLCYKGSNDTLELAVNTGSAAQQLQATVGDEIEINI